MEWLARELMSIHMITWRDWFHKTVSITTLIGRLKQDLLLQQTSWVQKGSQQREDHVRNVSQDLMCEFWTMMAMSYKRRNSLVMWWWSYHCLQDSCSLCGTMTSDSMSVTWSSFLDFIRQEMLVTLTRMNISISWQEQTTLFR